ncbi:toxin [Streptomyces sp. Tu 6176]|uniref:DUF397 domain-containing protein n=1 Tax=Streptomyces sp. Tu 6176 TaxID=1470557 RepID=UPI00044F5EFF|nr:DUF397 domain-containing protein [Streptomyces sp. Tu 6176]EYT84481.1 toxin [Streptomyces sp. Tu 6176]
MSTPELHWFKSSYSDGTEGDSCVEVALTWFKSSYSSSSNGNDCVEVAHAPTTIHVRDSKITGGPQLALAPDVWADFVSYASES